MNTSFGNIRKSAPRNARLCSLMLMASLLATCLGAARAEDEAVGRLFFTPERRAALDRQRGLNIHEGRVMEGNSLTVNGVIRRSSGKSTVWINGVPHNDDLPTSDVQPRIDPRDPSKVVLTTGQEPPVELKVGESINRATREKGDGLDGGSVEVKRGVKPR
jgi:hypothetical protein